MILKLRKSEIRWLFILLMVLGGVTYRNKYYRPKKNILDAHHDTYRSLQVSLRDLKNEAPNIEEKQVRIHAFKKTLAFEEQRFRDLGAQIPKKTELDRFLRFLTLEENSPGIEFTGISPLKPSESRDSREEDSPDALLAGYKQSRFEITVSGGYSAILNYVDYLEKLSRFAHVETFSIAPPGEEPSLKLQAGIRFAVLISDEPGREREAPFHVDVRTAGKQVPSPFPKPVRREKPVEEAPEPRALPEFTVSGIISVGDEYRVVLDGRIYREGDTIEESRIQSIRKNSVIFETAGTTHEVVL
jgi:Tfp pilus assembly protein PilO